MSSVLLDVNRYVHSSKGDMQLLLALLHSDDHALHQLGLSTSSAAAPKRGCAVFLCFVCWSWFVCFVFFLPPTGG